MMKKNVLTLVVASALCACNNKPQYQVSGYLEGLEGDSLIVMVMDADFSETETTDTVALIEGNFAFNLPQKEMRQVLMAPMPSGGKKLFQDGYVNFMFMPGDYATINGTLKDYEINGTGFYKEFKESRKLFASCEEAQSQLFTECKERKEKGENPDSLSAYFQKRNQEIRDEVVTITMNYIKQHPDSDVSTYLVVHLEDKMEEGLALLTERARNGLASGFYKSFLKRREKEKKREEMAKNIQPGKEAPDFTLMDLNGNSLTLSSLRGKYVVLDFWGSWCGWCIKGFPEMKKYYAKYKNKVEFLGIACGDTEKKWKDAVAKHEVPWLNVLNGKDDKDVSTMYAISGYPTKIVIDPQGEIARVVVGESPEFYTYLDGLFK